MKGRRILVTGGAGFIASHLVDALLEREAQVKIVDDLSNGKLENVNKKAQVNLISILDRDELRKCVADVDVIFHLAAETGTRETSMGFYDPFKEMHVNAEGTVNILESVRDCNPSARIVFASSAAVYGEPRYIPVDEKHQTDPVSPYGISKLAAEKYLVAYMKSYQVKPVIARIFNTYGPRQSRYVIHDLIKKLTINQDQLMILGTGSSIRDYAYVTDTVEALIMLAEQGEIGEIYNISGENPVSIEYLAKLILKILNLTDKTNVKYTGISWKGDIMRMVADITKIKALGFRPRVNLETGIRNTINWFNTHN